MVMFRYVVLVFAFLRFVSVQKLACKKYSHEEKNVCPAFPYSGCQVSNMMLKSIVLILGEAEEVVLVS